MEKILNRLKNNSFFNSVITLMSGSVIAQAITLIASIFMARIYSPAELGIYTLILTAESLFGSVICLRYDVAVVSEKNDKKVIGIVKLSFLITVILSIIASVGYGYIKLVLKTEYNQYSFAIVFIALMLVFRGVINVLESFNNRNKEYKLMTSVYIVRTFVQNGGAIILGLLGFGVWGIIITHTLGLLCGIKRQAKPLLSRKKEIKEVNATTLMTVAKENYKQPVYSSPAIFANRYSYSSITLFVEALFGVEMLGFYSISYKALGLPLTVLSNNVSKVFFKDASVEFANTGKFKSTFKKTSMVLSILAVPMGIIIYFGAPLAFKIVFGAGWEQSGVIVQILIPMFCVRFVVNTVAYGLQVAGKQNFELIFQLLLVGASIVAYLSAKWLMLTVLQYLRIITVSFSVIYIIYYLCVMKYAIFGVDVKEEVC